MALTDTPDVKVTHRAIRIADGKQLYVGGDLAVDGATELDGAVTMNSTLAVTGAQTVAGLDSTGRITTTDGVASGTARVVGGKVAAITAAGTAHTNSTDEAVLASATLPANTIKAGTIVKVRFQMIASSTTGATTLTVRLRLGATTLTGTALITTGAVDAEDNMIVAGYAELVGRAAPGAAAAVVGVTNWCEPATSGGAVLTGFLGSTNFATNGALLIELTADWSAADANTCRADVFNVEVIG